MKRSRELLRDRFFTVWLKAAPETIYARLTSDPQTDRTRPPLSSLPIREEICQVLGERNTFYAQVAAARIDTEAKQPFLVAREIETLLAADLEF